MLIHLHAMYALYMLNIYAIKFMFNPFHFRREPAYSFGYPQRLLKTSDFPGPGEHDPKLEYVIKAKPAFSFGYPFRNVATFQNPAPNTYCEKKVNSTIFRAKIVSNPSICTSYVYLGFVYFQFILWKKAVPAPSFGIRHSPYIGTREPYLKSSKLDLLLGSQ